MIGSASLDVMNSTNSDLRWNWKTVKKGRRSRKSGARNLTDASKAVNFVSPKRVGDFSGSDSEKLGEGLLGQLISGKSENVPIKKRRHLLCQDFVSQHLDTPVFEDRGQHPSHSSDHEYNATDDFSGIELLAAAASMDGNFGNGDEDVVAKDSSLNQTCSDASDAAAAREICFKSNNTLVNSSNMSMQGFNPGISLLASDSAASFGSLGGNTEDGTVPKVVNRQHWDLNTQMDAWDEPDGPVTGMKGLNDDTHMEKRMNESSDYKVLNVGGDISTEPLKPNLEENNSVIALVDETRIDLRCIESTGSYYSSVTACGVHDEATENFADEMVPDQALCSSSRKDSPDMVMNANAMEHSSPSSKPCSILGSEEKMGSTSDAVDNSHIDDCSVYLTQRERTRTSDKLQSIIQRGITHGMSTSDESAIELLYEDTESLKTSEITGTIIQDSQTALMAKYRNQTDMFVGFSIPRSIGAELVEEHDDNNLHMKELKGITVEDSSKSSSAGIRDDRVSLDGKVDSANNAQHDSDVSQGHHSPMVDGCDLTVLQTQEGYNSPSEDGELRRSSLYSLEDLDNEYVDYESDGRKGDDADMAEHPGSELVEGNSEISHCTERRDPAQKRYPEGGGKFGPIKQTGHFVNDGSVNNEMAGKGSNAGSGTTVEQSIEMIKEKDSAGKRQSTDIGYALDAKILEVDQYASEVAREKYRSRIEERSSMDAADVNASSFTQPFRRSRSRHLRGPYPRPERDMSPKEYMGRYRPIHCERDGAQWTSMPLRRCHTSNYELAEVRTRNRQRNFSNESCDERIGGLDYHVTRQAANYMPKGLHEPGARRFNEKTDYIGVRRRIHPTRGGRGANFRGRGQQYLHRSERNFDDFPPVDDDIAPPPHFPRPFSRRERSFSPSSGRSTHMHTPRRRPRSRSRSRSQSPRTWHSRKRTLGRRHPRSPDYGSESPGETLRLPFQKPAFTSRYGDGYTSPSDRRFSPQRNYRFVRDPTFTESHFRRKRSPGRAFRHPQTFDTVSSSRHLKSGDYDDRPPQIRKGQKFDPYYNGRRRRGGSELITQARPSDGGGCSIRKFQHRAADNFETGHTNDVDGALVSDRKEDTPQARLDGGEDKRVV